LLSDHPFNKVSSSLPTEHENNSNPLKNSNNSYNFNIPSVPSTAASFSFNIPLHNHNQDQNNCAQTHVLQPGQIQQMHSNQSRTYLKTATADRDGSSTNRTNAAGTISKRDGNGNGHSSSTLAGKSIHSYHCNSNANSNSVPIVNENVMQISARAVTHDISSSLSSVDKLNSKTESYIFRTDVDSNSNDAFTAHPSSIATPATVERVDGAETDADVKTELDAETDTDADADIVEAAAAIGVDRKSLAVLQSQLVQHQPPSASSGVKQIKFDVCNEPEHGLQRNFRVNQRQEAQVALVNFPRFPHLPMFQPADAHASATPNSSSWTSSSSSSSSSNNAVSLRQVQNSFRSSLKSAGSLASDSSLHIHQPASSSSYSHTNQSQYQAQIQSQTQSKDGNAVNSSTDDRPLVVYKNQPLKRLQYHNSNNNNFQKNFNAATAGLVHGQGHGISGLASTSTSTLARNNTHPHHHFSTNMNTIMAATGPPAIKAVSAHHNQIISVPTRNNSNTTSQLQQQQQNQVPEQSQGFQSNIKQQQQQQGQSQSQSNLFPSAPILRPPVHNQNQNHQQQQPDQPLSMMNAQRNFIDFLKGEGPSYNECAVENNTSNYDQKQDLHHGLRGHQNRANQDGYHIAIDSANNTVHSTMDDNINANTSRRSTYGSKRSGSKDGKKPHAFGSSSTYVCDIRLVTWQFIAIKRTLNAISHCTCNKFSVHGLCITKFMINQRFVCNFVQ
jgi:hypothetical protein